MTEAAYTVGARRQYETYLDTDPEAGKGVGGSVWRTLREAADAIGARNGASGIDGWLPGSWGYGDARDIPARVYAVILPNSFEEDATTSLEAATLAQHRWYQESTPGAAVDRHQHPEADCPDCRRYVADGIGPGEARLLVTADLRRLEAAVR